MATVVIAALVVVNVVLVALALRPRSAPDDHVMVTPSAQGPSSTPDASDSSVSNTPTPSATSAHSNPVPLQVLVSAVDSEVAWRATSAGCDASAAVVETTADGGRTWRPVESPARAVVRVKATSASKAFVVGASADCGPLFRSTANGKSWAGSSTALGHAWYRSPSDPNRIGVPGGKTSVPCGKSVAVIDLVLDGASHAAALCADERVVETTDTAQSWQRVATVPGAVALAENPVGQGYAVAAVGTDGCPGIAVRTVAATSKTLGCIAKAEANAGRVAIATTSKGVWVVSDRQVYLSTDEAASFSRRA